MKQVFFIVGHSNWGKSKTLKALTAGNRRVKYYTIANTDFVIRRMSNDDNEAKLLEFVKSATKYNRDLVIAFCPKFIAPRKGRKILDILAKEFSLFFFVLKKKYRGNLVVSEDEITVLQQFGDVFQYDKKEEADLRAKSFERYIRKHLTK